MDLLAEVFDDGGIRVVPPDGRPGMATADELGKWVRLRASQGRAGRITGHTSSPLGRAVVDQIRDDVPSLTVEESDPAPFKRGWTSLMWAAEHGLLAETVDLLERGASPSPRSGRRSPYRLAMRRGQVPVMAALRAARGEPPRLPRPPGAPDAIVMRMYVGWLFWWLAPVPVIVGVVAAIATGQPMAALVGAVLTAVVAVLGAYADAIFGRNVVAVDGPLLYSRRFWRWRGPVDLRSLEAIGLRESAHVRTPALLRLVNGEHGEPIVRRATHAGLDTEIVDRLRQRPELRVLTIYLAWSFLRPGFEHYVASHVDPQRTLISSSAEVLFKRA